jgi:hypothetical protein
MEDIDKPAYVEGVSAARAALDAHGDLRPQNPYPADSDEWLAYISGFRNTILAATKVR